MIFVAVLMIAWGCWNLFRRPASRELKEIHCLRGTPKRWGLFGESGQGRSATFHSASSILSTRRIGSLT